MKIGSLFSGYGGLDMAVEAVTGAGTAWVSDIEPAACKVLAARIPAPNLGDISQVEWDDVEPIDILTGGFPCQDVSAAGKRGGLIRAIGQNRSGLWAEMARAIDSLRPRLVVAENVRGLLSAKTDAHAAIQSCAPCVDNAGGDESLGMRALGAVLGDLAELGYDAAWRVVRASDVGAPHQRARVFVVAWPADRAGLAQWCQQPAWDERAAAQRSDIDPADVALLPTPWASSFNDVEDLDNWQARRDRIKARGINGNGMGMPLGVAVRLLPTPQVADATGGHASRSGARSGELLLPGLARAYSAGALLPTPRATDGTKGGPNQRGSSGDLTMPSAFQPERWGKYADAVARWGRIVGPAPEPTETGPRGGQRLSPPFVEWMMGLPAGHITDPALGLSRNEQLKLGGNGVVPQQAEFAIRGLLADVARAVAA